MSNGDDTIGNGKQSDDDLLNFDFDDLSTAEVKQAHAEPSADDEVIDLLDVVEEDDKDGEQPIDLQETVDEAPALASDELAEAMDESIPSDLESELDAALDGLEPSLDFEESETEFKDSEMDEIESLLDEVEGPSDQEEELEISTESDDEATQVLDADVEAALKELDSSDLEFEKPEEEIAEPTLKTEPVDLGAPPAESEPSFDVIGPESLEDVEAELDSALEELDDIDLEMDSLEDISEEQPGVSKAEPSMEGPKEGDEAQPEEASEDVEAELDAALEGFESTELGIEDIEEMVEKEDDIETLISEDETIQMEIPSEGIPDGGTTGDVEAALEAELEGIDTGDIESAEGVLPVEDAGVSTEEEVAVEEGAVPDGQSSPELELMDSGLESVSEEIPEIDDDFPLEDLEDEATPSETEAAVEDEVPKLPPDDLRAVPGADITEMDSEAGAAVAEGALPISEERLEAVITQAIENVVEKVARETMVNVAEKLIGEALDALKKTLESSRE